jgi:hypothetical protein
VWYELGKLSGTSVVQSSHSGALQEAHEACFGPQWWLHSASSAVQQAMAPVAWHTHQSELCTPVAEALRCAAQERFLVEMLDMPHPD